MGHWGQKEELKKKALHPLSCLGQVVDSNENIKVPACNLLPQLLLRASVSSANARHGSSICFPFWMSGYLSFKDFCLAAQCTALCSVVCVQMRVSVCVHVCWHSSDRSSLEATLQGC